MALSVIPRIPARIADMIIGAINQRKNFGETKEQG